MRSSGTKIIKNASVLFVSQLTTWGLTLLLTVFLPRYLGPAALGQFSIANSIWAIAGVMVTFGMDTLLIKEIARHPEKTADLLGTTLVLRTLFYILSWGIIALYLYLVKYPTETIYLICIFGISHLIGQFGFAYQAALQGLEAMKYVSLAGIVGKAIYTVLCILLVLMGYSLYAIAAVSIVTALVNSLLQFTFLNRQYKLHFRFAIPQARAMLRASAPYLVSSLTLIIYQQIDILIISSLVNENAVGWYSTAVQLFSTLMFVPIAFTTSIFPALARTYIGDRSSLPLLMRKSFDLMLLLGVPIGLGLLIIAKPLIALLFGPTFAPSSSILMILGVVLIFTYQNTLVGQFLISTDRANAWSIVMIVAAVVTVPLDLLLVPLCQQMFGNGAIGGSLSFMLTELGMVVAGVRLLPKGSLGWPNVRFALSIISAGLVMIAAAWWWRDMFIGVPIVVGAVTYTCLIALMRVVPSEDIIVFKQMAQGILRRLRRSKTEPIGITGV
jgi:O-antigen/teichoic acid export membrane protein